MNSAADSHSVAARPRRSHRHFVRAFLAAITGCSLLLFLLVNLAAAQDSTGEEPPAQSTPAAQVEPSLVPAPMQPSALPPDGEIVQSPETPDWVLDLMARNAPTGIATTEMVVEKLAAAEALNGGDIFYTVTLTNTSGTALRNILLRDVLPRDALRDIQCLPAICEHVYEERQIPEPLGGTITVTETRELSWTIAIVPPGGRIERRFMARIVGQLDGAVIKNQAFAYYQFDGADYSASSNEVETTILVGVVEGVGASVSKAPTWFSSDRGGTLSLDWGDFDRDGDLDLALASSVGTTIYRNDDGVLRRLWSNTRRSFGVRWGDFTGNGYLDLVVAGEQGSSGGINFIYSITGSTVQESQRFTSTHQLVRVAPGDFDGDGDLDLVVSTNAINASCPVLLYVNEGGIMTPTESCLSRRATASIGVGDVDNDGDLDLALGLFPNSVQLFRNDGNGVFSPSDMIDNTTSFLPYDFAWGDFNGDGFLDLAAAYPLLRQARIYANQGGAGFAPPIILHTDRFQTPYSLDWGDFNGDGKLDLAVADLALTIYSFDGETPVQREQLTTSGLSGQIWALRGVDLDLDGDLDLTVTNRDGPSVIFSNFGSLLSPQLSPVPSSGDLSQVAASSVHWGDLDGDGSFDLLFSAGPTVVASKRYLNRQATFFREDEATLGGFGPHVAAIGDVDNDGNLDIAIGSDQNIVVYLSGNIASANWTSSALPARPTALAWGDYDDDGDLDLLVATAGGSIRLYRNDAVGIGQVGLTTGPVWQSSAQYNATALAWADLNGDAYLDFAIGVDGAANRIYVNSLMENHSVTSFVLDSWLPAVQDDATRALAWADYDGDGDLDLAVGNYGQANYIYRNLGGNGVNFSTTPIWQSSTLSRTTSLAWGDWDNDGDLDLAVGNDGEVDQVYVNRGGQLFWLWSSPEAQRTSGVAWGDVDRDGDLDLAVSQLGGGSNGFYVNNLIVAAHLEDEYAPRIPLPNNPLYVNVQRPGETDGAFLYSSPQVLSGPRDPVVPIVYRLYDPNGDRGAPGSDAPGQPLPAGSISYQFSLDGGGVWQTATSATVITPTDLITPTRLGVEQIFYWDAQADQAISENALFRIQLVQPTSSGPVYRASASATSPPFRVRGTSCQWPHNVRIIASPANPRAGESVRFVAGVEASGNISATWSFGDGVTFTGQVVQHQYLRDGMYTVRLTVSGEACPQSRPQSVIAQLQVGTGTAPLFLPLVMSAGQDGGQVRSTVIPRFPAQVTGLQGSEEDGSLLLRWDEPAEPASILLYRIYSGLPDELFTVAAVAPPAATTARIDEPRCGTLYYVVAVGRGGNGPASDGAYYTTPCVGGDE